MEQNKMKTFGKNNKELAKTRPTPLCPRCGAKARETITRYGVRSECCGLHSWDRAPLVDQATHDARKALVSLLVDLKRNIGALKLSEEVKKRAHVPYSQLTDVQTMNEATCKKIIAAMEGVLMDIMAGDIQVGRK